MSEETKTEQASTPEGGASATAVAPGPEAGGATPAAPGPEAGGVPVAPANPPEVAGSEISATPSGLGLEHLFDIALGVSVELGTTRLPIETLVKLGPGSVVTLDQSVTQPVELYVNGTPVARGEVVTIGENYGVRITSILEPSARIKALG